MTAPHHDPVRAALRRLAVTNATAGSDLPPLPLLLRAPWLVTLWTLLLVTGVGTLALGRIRLPHAAPGVVVVIPHASPGRSAQTLLLFEPASRAHLRAGLRVTVDTGGNRPLMLSVTHVEPALLDEQAARARFASPGVLLAHLDGPKAVAHLACVGSDCLTPQRGASYPGIAALGTRTIASYVMPRS